MNAREMTKELLDFIEESPTAFHAAANVEKRLLEAGFKKRDSQTLCPGGKYYEMRNGSAIVAYRIPQEKIGGFRIVASHSDSPCFKVKEAPEISVEGVYQKLNTEKYGGMILHTWMDRPLSVAGRVIFKHNDGLVEKLVNLEQDLLIIPSVAIHFNREVNDGQKLNPQVDLLPLFSLAPDCKLLDMCADALQILPEQILGSDLYVYNRDRGRIMGADQSLVGAPRLDDLQCGFATLQGFLEAASGESVSATDRVLVYALFDNEEVGSGTKQGADSTFLEDVLEDIMENLGAPGRTEKKRLLSGSFLLSADNGHALHPNHPEKSDPTNRPYINGGVVLKFQGSQRYATDGYSAAVVRDICQKYGIPVQNFANRADIPGGSTLGNISTAHVSIPSADIGLAQLAMHSAFETAGVEDTLSMAQLVGRFLSEAPGII